MGWKMPVTQPARLRWGLRGLWAVKMGEGGKKKKDVVICFTSAKEKNSMWLKPLWLYMCVIQTTLHPSTWLHHYCYHHQASGMQTDTVSRCLNIILNPHWTDSSAEISASFLIFTTSSSLKFVEWWKFHIIVIPVMVGGWKGSVLRRKTTIFMTWGGTHSSSYYMCTKNHSEGSIFLTWWRKSHHHHHQATSEEPGPWKRDKEREGKETNV